MTYTLERLRLDIIDFESLTGIWVESAVLPEKVYDDLLRELYDHDPWNSFSPPGSFESLKEHLRVSMQVITFYGVVVTPGDVADPVFKFRSTTPATPAPRP